MNTLESWKSLSVAFNNNLNDALQQQHHAAQFIALVGRHLIPQKPDDSNTNMEFIPKKDILLGNDMPNGMRVALQLSEMKLNILDKENKVKKIIGLDGKTKQRVFGELSQSLADLGVDVTSLKNELHYDIPEYRLEKGSVFSVKNKSDFIENSKYRHNAKIVLNEIGKLFEYQELIRIWPHHFDTGAVYTISKNEKGEATQTIGIGMAIPDSMVEEPYYYLSFWSEKPFKGIENIVALHAGRWMMPKWNGAILRHSEILEAGSADNQYELVSNFFTNGLDKLKTHF